MEDLVVFSVNEIADRDAGLLWGIFFFIVLFVFYFWGSEGSEPSLWFDFGKGSLCS